MFNKIKDALRRRGEAGFSKTKAASLAFILVQVTKLFGYEVPVENATDVIEGVLAIIAVIGLYQKVERTQGAE